MPADAGKKNTAMKTIKVGDKITYRGGWGNNEPKEATVENIEYCCEEHTKYGVCVNEVEEEDVRKSVFDLDDGHWCYGYQIEMK